jgi:hypothetical protein
MSLFKKYKFVNIKLRMPLFWENLVHFLHFLNFFLHIKSTVNKFKKIMNIIRVILNIITREWFYALGLRLGFTRNIALINA